MQNKKEAGNGFFFHGDLSSLVFGFQQFNQLGHSTFLTAHQNFIHQLFDLLRAHATQAEKPAASNISMSL